MPYAFSFAHSPFDCLEPDEQRMVRDHADIGYYAPGQVLLEPGAVPAHLFVVTKGHVAQEDHGDTVVTYGPDDCFDGRSLVAGRASSRFVATEEVITYELARATVLELIARNATFGALLFSDLGHKLSVLARRQHPRDVPSLSLSRVADAFLRPVHEVPAALDVLSAVRRMHGAHTASVLVRDDATTPPRRGIFSRTLLERAILAGRPLHEMPVGDWARFPVIEVRAGDSVGDAMALMLRHRIHRLVVVDGERTLGMLESLDLLSYVSNPSHLVALQIDNATSLDALAGAAAQIDRVVTVLFRSGTRVGLVAHLVQQLNARLFLRAWQLIAPPELVANSCLFVMGSEGRGEQLLKTDQDNGLILRDGYTPPQDLDAICERFSQALGRFGYPPCPGGIMLSRPLWRRSASAWAQQLQDWVWRPEGEALMHLAIFLDAHAVAGDAALLDAARAHLLTLATDHEGLQSRFAAAIDAFGPGGPSWWSRLFSPGAAPEPWHIKKEGLFPLVHGVRSLALAHRVEATGTTDRIEALVARGALSPGEGEDLAEALQVLMALRLKAGLAEREQQRPISGTVMPGQLGSLDRDLLKDALGVVKRFQQMLRTRFHLGVL
jgi:CBS domain-containing protein